MSEELIYIKLINNGIDNGKILPVKAHETDERYYRFSLGTCFQDFRKSDCEVVPTLQPEKEQASDFLGNKYAQELEQLALNYCQREAKGLDTPNVTALEKNAFKAGFRTAKSNEATAFDNGFKQAQKNLQVVPEGQHLISTQQLKELHDKLGSCDLIQQRSLLQEWFPTVFVPAKTYKVGDMVAIEGEVFAIAPAGDDHTIILIAKDFKTTWDVSFKVKDWDNITEEELQNHIQEPFTLLPDTTRQLG